VCGYYPKPVLLKLWNFWKLRLKSWEKMMLPMKSLWNGSRGGAWSKNHMLKGWQEKEDSEGHRKRMIRRRRTLLTEIAV
jgi:hypothetical protein